MQTGNKKEVIVFNKSIPANTDYRFTERVKANGTIEKLQVRFYRGQQLALRVIPYVLHKGERKEDLVTFNGKAFLDGEDDTQNFTPVIPVEYDDQVIVDVVNTDLTYDYDAKVVIEIDYFAGTDRVIGGVVSGD